MTLGGLPGWGISTDILDADSAWSCCVEHSCGGAIYKAGGSVTKS